MVWDLVEDTVAGSSCASVPTATGRSPGARRGRLRGRPLGGDGGPSMTCGVPTKTVAVLRMPNAYGRRRRSTARRNALGSPYSASPTTPVICRPAARAAQQRQTEPPFLLKLGARRHPCGTPSLSIGRPDVRQVELCADRPGAQPRPECGRHGHLTVRNLAHGAAVLPGHADRMPPLFRETRFVEDQHAAPFGQDRQQPAPHGARTPRRMREEVLERGIGGGLDHPRQHRLHRLARAVAQQPLHVLAQRHVLRAMPKAVFELVEPARESSQQCPGPVVSTAVRRSEIEEKVQCPQNRSLGRRRESSRTNRLK